jgi:hypothetical protein
MWKQCGIICSVDLGKFEAHPVGIVRHIDTQQVVKTELRGKGKYPTLVLRMGGKTNRVRMHLIILETFKPKPHPSLQCDHINEDKLDYSLKNLRWVSCLLNISFCKPQGYICRKGKYLATFHGKTWGEYHKPKEAYEKHLCVKQRWQKQEMTRILSFATAEQLNWV